MYASCRPRIGSVVLDHYTTRRPWSLAAFLGCSVLDGQLAMHMEHRATKASRERPKPPLRVVIEGHYAVIFLPAQ